MGAKATYVYCVVQARSRPRVAHAPSGLPGFGNVRLLDAERTLWLVVADAPQPRYSEASISRGLRDLEWVSQCAVAHEAVVEHWRRARAIVPMKLFTIFESDERALAYIRRRRQTLDHVIRRVAGKREWGVRVRQSRAPVPERRVLPAASGTGYLTAKKQARDAAKEQTMHAQARANAVFATLAARAVEAERRPATAAANLQSRLLLDAAFLVGTGRIAQFREAARRLTRDLQAEGYAIELTGPWPPYNFIGP